jgi:hypothetical protein
MVDNTKSVSQYVKQHVKIEIPAPADKKDATLSRIEKTLSVLPDHVLDLFLKDKRNLTIRIVPDLQVPFGMSVQTEGLPKKRRFTITIYAEQLDWPEDLFIGSLLRELAHVVAGKPPESEWPAARGDRARFKERLEYIADATVWKWGLRHYSIRHLTSTYPEHWVDRIVDEITRIVMHEGDKLP